MTQPRLKEAYQFCQNLAQSHYENFPVASVLLPTKLRQPISVIYAFARTADDFADEGDATQEIRLQQLNTYSEALHAIALDCYQGEDLIFIALTDVVKKHHLPITLFNDLLDAFKQDVVKDRYESFNDVLDYCRRSADPVGRLLLLLSNKPSLLQLEQSDSICSALQLINFYQDIVQDVSESNRIYIPNDELEQFEISEQQLANIDSDTTALSPLLRLQYQRAKEMMLQGYQLGAGLDGRIGWEIRAMTLGGVMTLSLLISQSDNSLLARPRLSKWSLFKIMLISMSKTYYSGKVEQLLNSN